MVGFWLNGRVAADMVWFVGMCRRMGLIIGLFGYKWEQVVETDTVFVWFPSVWAASQLGDALAAAVVEGLRFDPVISRLLRQYEQTCQDQREGGEVDWEPRLTSYHRPV